MLLYQFDAAVSRVFSWSVFKREEGSGFRVVVAASLQYIWGDARRFLGKQVSHLSVSAMILLTANDKDFSLRSK